MRILAIIAPENLESATLKRLENQIKLNYNAQYRKYSDLNTVLSACNETMPHVIIIDTSLRDLRKRLNDAVIDFMEEIPVILFTPENADNLYSFDISLNTVSRIRPFPTDIQLKIALDEAAQAAGFSTTTGKIRSRLVKKRIRASLSIEGMKREIRADVTGLNKNGMGARVKRLKMHGYKEARCMVVFDKADFEAPPLMGKILRVEESFQQGYDAFVAVKFVKEYGSYFDPVSMDKLQTMIKIQRDTSIKK